MSFLVVANFKSHKTQGEVRTWIKEVAPAMHIVVAPAFPHLALFADKKFAIAGQDVSSFPPGSYTGAVNAKQLHDLGVTYCIIGHSERRHYFHETSMEIASKAQVLIEVGITPIVCLTKGDIQAQHATLGDDLVKKCLFCYEPVADIGGTETASIEDITETTSEIKQIFSTDKVMYGGSVNEGNIKTLLSLQLAGVLVASASLSSASFNQIIVQIPHDQKI